MLWILKSHVSVKGVNDMPIAQVVLGYITLAQFHGKHCVKRAERWKRLFEQGKTPNNYNV